MINEKKPVKHDPATVNASLEAAGKMFELSAGLVVEPGRKRIALSEAGLTQKQVEDFFKSFQSFKKMVEILVTCLNVCKTLRVKYKSGF